MQRLHQLIESNDFEAFKSELAEYKDNIDTLSGKKDLALLHLCAIKDRVKFAEILLEAGASANVRDEYNVEPLHYAASTGATKVMEILIDNGANLSALDNMKRSPLECAVRYNRLTAVKILLENHVNVNSKNKHGGTSLHQAAEAGNLDMIQLLLQFKADVNAVTESRRTPLHYAAQKGHVDILRVLLDHGADVNATETKLKETPLHRTASGGSSVCVEALLHHKADLHALNQNRRTPLHKACLAGNIDTLTCLIVHGSAIGLKDKNGKTALENCANSATRSAFDRALKEKRGEPYEPVKERKIVKRRTIERDQAMAAASLLDIERDNQKNILHLKCVFQAITKAAGDAGIHIAEISKRHNELCIRENEDNGNIAKIKDLKENVETELKHLHQVLSDISQTVNASQDEMERCIFSSETNLDSTYDSTADWEADTIDDTQDSYDKLDQLTSNFSDSEEKEIEEEPPKILSSASTSPATAVDTSTGSTKVTRKVSLPSPKTSPKGARRDSKELKSSKRKKSATLLPVDKKKRMKRSKSAKKLKSTTKTTPLKRQVSDAELKSELSQMDKEELLAMALKLKESEDTNTIVTKTVRTTSSPPNSPRGGTGMNKRLKHRIPSKTRLRIAPLG